MAHSPLTRKIAGNIRAEVTRGGYRASDLAEVIERSRNATYQKWNGQSAFTLVEIDRIAQWLGVDVEILLTTQD